MNYCDENGCQDRKRRYTAFGISLLHTADLVKHLLENVGNEEQVGLVAAEMQARTLTATPAPAAAPATGVAGEAVGLPAIPSYNTIVAMAEIIFPHYKHMDNRERERAREEMVRVYNVVTADALATPAAPGPGAAAGTGEAATSGDLYLLRMSLMQAQLRASMGNDCNESYGILSEASQKSIDTLSKWLTPPTTGAATAAPATGGAA